MYVPLVILAILSAIAGFAPVGHFVGIGEAAEHHGINLAIALPASAMAVLGIAVAWFFYAGQTNRAAVAAAALGRLYRVVKQKFYIDEIYLFVTQKIIFRFVARPVAWFDRHVVDGGVNLSAWLTRKSGSGLRYLQTGQVQVYGLWLVGGMLFLLLIVWAALIR
jgi:NADH-quinone oxidoreductase subunit L